MMKKLMKLLGFLSVMAMLLVVSCKDDDETFDKLLTSEDVVRVMQGEIAKVAILSGSGKYKVYSSDEAIVKTTLSENKIEINGIVEGEANVIVKDLKSDEMVIIEVGVDTDPNKLTFESSIIKVKEGETIKVPILSGNGKYEMEEVDNENLTATLKVDTVIITGKYQTDQWDKKLKVKDVLTNEIIILAVEVIGVSETPAKPAEDIYTTIEITTKAVEEKEEVGLKINAKADDRAGVWVDINNNGKKDDGETVTEFCENIFDENSNKFAFKPASKVVRIYGKITDLSYGIGDYWSKGYARTFDMEHNPFLEKLGLKSRFLKELDLGKAKKLKTLIINYCGLRTLNVKGCTSLEELDCSNNRIVNFDVSKMTSLKKLNCSRNAQFMESMNISGCTGLEELSVGSNMEVKSIDLTACTKLKKLDYDGATFESVDLTPLVLLEELTLSMSETTSLDVSNNKELRILNCYGNTSLTNLDVSQNTKLEELKCDVTRISSLDLGNNRELKVLNCENTKLTTLNVSQLTLLENLNISNTQITTLDLNTEVLVSLSANNCKLSSINISKCPALESINLGENELTSLDVSKCTELTDLDISANQIASLDLSNCTALTSLNVSKNKLTNLDFSACTELDELNVSQNLLTSLDISECENISEFNCSRNKLISLNVANGANDDIYSMKATGNPDLTCIQHDEGFDPSDNECDGDYGWCKDDTANWSTDCSK